MTSPPIPPACTLSRRRPLWASRKSRPKPAGIDYVVGKFPMSANGKALILNGGEGLVKIIAGKEYGEVLGMHIIGPRATDLICEGALAIGSELTLDELVATIHSHPTVTESHAGMCAGRPGAPPSISLLKRRSNPAGCGHLSCIKNWRLFPMKTIGISGPWRHGLRHDQQPDRQERHHGPTASTPSPALRERFAKRGGKALETGKELYETCDVIFMCLPTNAIVKATISEIMETAKPGTTIVDMGSTSPYVIQELHATAVEKGFHLLDSPVSGGETGANGGTLVIMCGGEKEVFDDVKPYLEMMGKTVTYMGPLRLRQHGQGRQQHDGGASTCWRWRGVCLCHQGRPGSPHAV